MGTRNLTCVFKDGQYKVAQYCQWDGYPEGRGLDVLYFLNREMVEEIFLAALDDSTFISEEEYKAAWVECGADPDSDRISHGVSEIFKERHPELHRDTGPKVLSMIQCNGAMKLRNDLTFATDSLFCEWCYVIDFDTQTFEIYKGFNNSPLDEKDRFYNDGAIHESHDGTVYHPVKLIKTYNLDKLPSDHKFLSDIEAISDETEI